MNKSLDSYPKPAREAAESARTTTIPSMPKNQPRPTRKAKMVPKSGEPSYQHEADVAPLSRLLESSRSLKL
jgi:hypothetical protein